MKSRYIFLLTFLILFSCEEFLEVTPEDRIDTSTFMANDKEVIIGVNGVYAAQRQLFANFSTFSLLEQRADNSGMDHTDQRERVETDLFDESAGNLPVSLIWELSFNIINVANVVIANAPDATGDEALINRAIAEAKFLRAMTYFHALIIWGGLPLRTTPTVDFDNATLPRSSVDDTYNLIVQDLNDAVAGLPTSYDGSPNSEVGRATKGAALTLLGKVELQRGNKAAAETALTQVVGSYSLLPNYADIHAAGNNAGAEAIYEVNFNPGNQTGFGLPQSFIPQSVAEDLGIVAGGSPRPILIAYATQDLVDSFDPADLRIPYTFGIDPDVGPYISKYIDQAAAGAGNDINLVLLRYADVLLMLAEAKGEGTEAYGYINQVRARAGLAGIDATSPGTFMEKLMNERRWEFAFEYHRWIDLLRLPESEIFSIMKAQLEAQQLNKFGTPTTINLTSDNLLYPIPSVEVDISEGVVAQNPGF